MPFADAALGDIIRLPTDHRDYTVRGSARLSKTVGSMAGFLIAGELHALISTPERFDGPVSIYTVSREMPVEASKCRSAHEGVFRYWAPHLPSVQAAMGELAFRVLRVRGTVDPLVIVYRDDEPIIFTRATVVSVSDIALTPLERNDEVGEATRHAALVRAPGTPEPNASQLYESFTNVA